MNEKEVEKELVILPKWPNQDLPCDFEPLSHPLGLGRLTNKVLIIQCNCYDTCFTHGKIGQTRCLHNFNLFSASNNFAFNQCFLQVLHNASHAYTMLAMLSHERPQQGQ